MQKLEFSQLLCVIYPAEERTDSSSVIKSLKDKDESDECRDDMDTGNVPLCHPAHHSAGWHSGTFPVCCRFILTIAVQSPENQLKS